MSDDIDSDELVEIENNSTGKNDNKNVEEKGGQDFDDWLSLDDDNLENIDNLDNLENIDNLKESFDKEEDASKSSKDSESLIDKPQALDSTAEVSERPAEKKKPQLKPKIDQELKPKKPNEDLNPALTETTSNDDIATALTEAVTRNLRESSGNRLAIMGAKASGKTYFFHSLVFRLSATKGRLGALNKFVDGKSIHLFEAFMKTGKASKITMERFLRNYQSWNQLEFTRSEGDWYRLEIPYRNGWLGRNTQSFDVDFIDASGEAFFEAPINNNRETWDIFAEAETLVFCLPTWVAFPKREIMKEKDWQERDNQLEGFSKVVKNYSDVHEIHKKNGKFKSKDVKSILVLTMADDPRSNLEELKKTWIHPFQHSRGSRRLNKSLNSNQGIMRYLSDAQYISNQIYKEFENASDRIFKIINIINFGKNKPWIIPISAIDGETLLEYENNRIEKNLEDADELLPIPVHVELPLLVSFTDKFNALI